MKWIGQHIYDQVAKFRNIVDFSEDVTFYQPVNDANPRISFGSSSTERLLIRPFYAPGSQTLATVFFSTKTESGTANNGKMRFSVDDVNILDIDDGGINFETGFGISINGTDIITDSAGEATLSNIDTLDATTIATFEAAMEANLDTFGSQMTSASSLATIGTITTGIWNGQRIASTYLDDDTAHLSGNQTFTGSKTFSATTTQFTSAIADSPLLNVINTTDDDQAGRLMFTKLRDDDAVATGQNLGEIWFTGQDNAQNTQNYAYVLGEIDVSTGGQESGSLTLGIANHDGGMGRGLQLTGGSVDAEIDATIGLGSASVTTISGDLTVTGSDLTFDSVALTAVQTSGESFVDNDTSIMTSAAINDKISANTSVLYAYTYITWSASAVPSRDAENNPEWMLPNVSKGVYEEDWNNDSGIIATSTGTTTYAFSRMHAVNSLVMPHTGILVGFHGHGRNDDGDRTFKAGLFHADGSTTSATNTTGIDYGNTTATNEFTLRCVATADEAEASGGVDDGAGHSFKGPCKLVSNTVNLAVTAGDALLPAIMGNTTNSTDEIFVTMTIILKVPLTT